MAGRKQQHTDDFQAEEGSEPGAKGGQVAAKKASHHKLIPGEGEEPREKGLKSHGKDEQSNSSRR